ncbi:HD domain-containing phosphohydrolase [Sulfurimonas sp.]|uniref:HD domain-containing phosphohydrolase n=1 Tax=Sulfurimonas sp. TaxID=2022749 RepID=UPI003562516E
MQTNYKIWEKNQATQADIIYDITIKKDRVLDILSEAWNTKNNKKRDELREEFISILSSDYNTYRNEGLLQYHFVFPNNKVFVRLHKTEKYGDDLTNIRQDFEYVNRTKEVVRGFSGGRTAHAIRNVYPIFDKNLKHVGAVEISYPSELFQKKLNELSEIHTHYLVKKSIFDSKAWDRDDRILNYKPSIEHKDFLMTLSASHNPNEETRYKKHLENITDKLNKKMQKSESFAIFSNIDNDVEIISFMPIKQNTTKELSAWLVSYEDDPYLLSDIQDTHNARFFGIFIILILLIFIWKIIKQKDKLVELLNSYDNNVIFSETDLKGKITNVSSAFCDISGYNEDELVGKNHNIIRHPDMPKEVFNDMWETLKAGKHWSGDIKNLHKNGSYYWVKAEIEPMFNSNKKIIGYRAIRHNISDSKEIEKIQKEIIFTMGSIGESRSKETANHVKRVAEYSKLLASLYGLSQEDTDLLHMASPMHDIGKVAIPDSILLKHGKLNDEEYEIMKTHANRGYDMLKHSNRPLIATAAIIAHEHHEKWDGQGYPRGLSGEDIHIYGRITALVDVYDALISDRVYKKAWEEEEVLKHIKEQSAKHFDPKLVELFLNNYRKFQIVGLKYKD